MKVSLYEHNKTAFDSAIEMLKKPVKQQSSILPVLESRISPLSYARSIQIKLFVGSHLLSISLKRSLKT